jgi:uncharacterized protein YceK
MIRPAAVLMLLACAALGGCGTIANCVNCDKAESLSPYAATKRDCESIKYQLGPAPKFCWPADLVCSACDLPFSAVADTLLLPFTATWTMWHVRPLSEIRGETSPSSDAGTPDATAASATR